MQGIGWMTLEEIIYNIDGMLLTDNLSTYKVPDINFTPKDIDIEFLENSINKSGIMNSKAVGEPPFMYGIGAYFAIRNAVEAFKGNKDIKYIAPLTPERVLMNLYK
jgi:xanthine dehydrogenase large subunit